MVPRAIWLGFDGELCVGWFATAALASGAVFARGAKSGRVVRYVYDARQRPRLVGRNLPPSSWLSAGAVSTPLSRRPRPRPGRPRNGWRHRRPCARAAKSW